MKLRKVIFKSYSRKQEKIKPKKEWKEFEKIFPKIEFPEEIKFLDKLNKSNKKKYKEWLYKKILAEQLLKKSTLIIGVRGKNGIVLGGDTKAMRGGETDFENKVKTLCIQQAPIMFAAAGVVGVIDDFLEIFEKTLISNIKGAKITSLLSIKMLAEDLVEKTEERYGPKLKEYPINFILGGLAQLKEGEARLYEIGPRGFGAKIKYSSLIGHGSPYTRTIAKYLFPRDNKIGTISLECNGIVSRIAACIYWVGGEIDDYVGGEPQVVYMLDKKPEIKIGKYNKSKILNTVQTIKKGIEKVNF